MPRYTCEVDSVPGSVCRAFVEPSFGITAECRRGEERILYEAKIHVTLDLVQIKYKAIK